MVLVTLLKGKLKTEPEVDCQLLALHDILGLQEDSVRVGVKLRAYLPASK